MEKEIIKFICGLVLVAIVPVILIRQLRKEAVFSGTIENQRNVLYAISITSISVVSAINQNSEILMGTLIGCAIFQILGICGVNKLNMVGKQKEGLFVNKSQYLIFCVILLLFLSADYLLRGKSAENILNQIDGEILIFLFGIYLYFTYGKGDALRIWLHDMQPYFSKKSFKAENRKGIGETKNILKKKKLGIRIIVYILLAVLIVAGNWLLFDGASKLGVELKISQYCIGLTLITWSNNLLGILLEYLEEEAEEENNEESEEDSLEIEFKDGEALIEEAVEEKQNNLEHIVDGIIFSMTLVLGSIAIGKPIMIHIHMIYDLIIFGIISILFQFVSKIDSRLAGSGMATIYIGFIVYAFIR